MPAPARPRSAPSSAVLGTDGVVTATSNPFGTVLDVDFSKHPADTSAALWVTVERTVGGVSIGRVRGLDDYPSIGAMTVGYDHEPPLAVPVTYTATARAADGTTWTAAAVSVTVQPVKDRAWLKCLTRPSLSMLLTGESYPQWQRDVPTGVFRPPSRRGPVVRHGVRQLGTGTLTLQTLTTAEVLGLDALVLAGGVYLLQADPRNRATRPDVYVTIGSDQFNQPGGDPEYYTVPLPVTQVDRPSTRGSRVSLPGHTIGDLHDRFPTLGDYPRPLSQLLRF